MRAVIAVAGTMGVSSASAQKKAKKQPQPRKIQRIQVTSARISYGNVYSRNPLYLLRNVKIQKELKLDGDQKTEVTDAIKELSKKRREESKKARVLQGQERSKKFRKLQKQFNQDSQKKVKEILELKQLVRLGEIQLQMQGVRALLQPATQKKLKITAAQKVKFAEVQKASAVTRQKAFKDLRAGGRVNLKKFREKTEELKQSQEKNLHAVLTKEQRERFDKMKGKKFELPRRGGVLLLNGAGIRLQIQGVPGGKIRIRRVKRKAAKPQKKKGDK